MDDLLDSNPQSSLVFAFADNTTFAAQGCSLLGFAANSRLSSFMVFHMEGLAQHFQVRGLLLFTGPT